MEVGTVVYLKSGGPAMTITAIHPTGVACSWFDDEEKLNTEIFCGDSLTTNND